MTTVSLLVASVGVAPIPLIWGGSFSCQTTSVTSACHWPTVGQPPPLQSSVEPCSVGDMAPQYGIDQSISPWFTPVPWTTPETVPVQSLRNSYNGQLVVNPPGTQEYW